MHGGIRLPFHIFTHDDDCLKLKKSFVSKPVPVMAITQTPRCASPVKYTQFLAQQAVDTLIEKLYLALSIGRKHNTSLSRPV